MSGTITPFQWAEADRVDLRRYAGYPPYGTGGPNGQPLVIFPEPWFWSTYLLFETRIANLTAIEAAMVQARLVEIRALETAIPNSAANLETDQAAVWKHNPNELKQRTQLYRQWRMELCATLGVPPGPALSGTSGGGTMRCVV